MKKEISFVYSEKEINSRHLLSTIDAHISQGKIQSN